MLLAATATRADSETPNAAQAERIVVLVAQLGDRSFAERERATKELTRIGMPGEPALRAALSDADAEVRSRAERILQRIIEADLEARLAAFIADPQGGERGDLPGWQKFRSIAGSDRAARALFVRMQRSESALLAALDAGPLAASELLEDRCESLFQAPTLEFTSRIPEYSLGSIAALVFVSADQGVSIDEEACARLYQPINQAFSPAMADPVRAGVLKKLLGRWFVKDHGATVLYQKLYLAMNWDVSEGLELARSVLTKRDVPPYVRQYAVLLVGKLGDKGDIKLLTPLLDDESVCAVVPEKGREVQTQIRDVALASLIKLTDQKVSDYGFDRAQEHERLLYNVRTLGFADAAHRITAIARWRLWSTENLK